MTNPLADPRAALRDVTALMPLDTPPYLLPAWLGCVSWAMSNPDVLAAFRAETGNLWQPGRSGLERMIDEATGADWHFIAAFVLWVNANVWGSMDQSDAH